MASTNRQRYNNLGDNGATNGVTMALNGTTATWAVGHGFPTIASPSYAVFTVNPGTANEEIVQITACTAAGTTATVVRNFEATQGGANAAPACSAAAWSHGPTAFDFTGETSWTAMTLAGTWANNGGTDSTAAYRKDAAGFVHLKGKIKSGSGTITTLPAGYRGAQDLTFPTVTSNGASIVGGDVEVVSSTGVLKQNDGGNAFVLLDGITFLAEL